MQAELAEVNARLEQLEASPPPLAAPEGGGEGANTEALLAEIAALEATVQAKELEATGRGGASGAPVHARLVDEYYLIHRTLVTVLRRNAKLAAMLGELGDPKRLVAQREAVAKKRTELESAQAEVFALERAIKKAEHQLALAAAAREREADLATSEARKLHAEVGRLATLCSAAEAETAALRTQLNVAQSDLALGARFTVALGEALRSRAAELMDGEPLPTPALPAPSAEPPVRDGNIGAAPSAEPTSPALVDIGRRLLDASGDELVDELHALMRKHARMLAELRRRRTLTEEARASAERLRALALTRSVERASGPPVAVAVAAAEEAVSRRGRSQSGRLIPELDSG